MSLSSCIEDSDLHSLWLLANVNGRRFNCRNMNRSVLSKVSIAAVCEKIREPDIGLRISSGLLYGVCLLYKQKVNYMMSDVLVLSLRLQFQSVVNRQEATGPVYREEVQKFNERVLLLDDSLFDLYNDFVPQAQDLEFLRFWYNVEIGRHSEPVDYSTDSGLDTAQITMLRGNDVELELDFDFSSQDAVPHGAITQMGEIDVIAEASNIFEDDEGRPTQPENVPQCQRKRRIVVDDETLISMEQLRHFQNNYEVMMMILKLKKQKRKEEEIVPEIELGRDRAPEEQTLQLLLELTFHDDFADENVFNLSFPEIDISILRANSSSSIPSRTGQNSQNTELASKPDAEESGPVLTSVHARFMRYLFNIDCEEKGPHRRIQFSHICPVSVDRLLAANSFVSILELATKSLLSIESAGGSQLLKYDQILVVVHSAI